MGYLLGGGRVGQIYAALHNSRSEYVALLQLRQGSFALQQKLLKTATKPQ
jgi:hypothetical protein